MPPNSLPSIQNEAVHSVAIFYRLIGVQLNITAEYRVERQNIEVTVTVQVIDSRIIHIADIDLGLATVEQG